MIGLNQQILINWADNTSQIDRNQYRRLSKLM